MKKNNKKVNEKQIEKVLAKVREALEDEDKTLIVATKDSTTIKGDLIACLTTIMFVCKHMAQEGIFEKLAVKSMLDALYEDLKNGNCDEEKDEDESEEDIESLINKLLFK